VIVDSVLGVSARFRASSAAAAPFGRMKTGCDSRRNWGHLVVEKHQSAASKSYPTLPFSAASTLINTKQSHTNGHLDFLHFPSFILAIRPTTRSISLAVVLLQGASMGCSQSLLVLRDMKACLGVQKQSTTPRTSRNMLILPSQSLLRRQNNGVSYIEDSSTTTEDPRFPIWR
jgi:hypothetical protein